MKTLVQKFGGTSLASPERILKAAEKALLAKKQGHPVILVVSAMATETDRLLNLCSTFSLTPLSGREVDVVASTGETVSAALTALAIRSLGGKARSFLGHQLPILTNSQANRAQIVSLNPRPLLDALANDEIPVVAGFQGVDSFGRITTLGRGGSDTTAVAIAAAIPDSLCEIYTDVNGVFTADPRTVPKARQLPFVSYKFMIEASELGAKVMHDRSVILGDRYGVPIHVKSSLSDGQGTFIGNQETHSRCVAIRKNEVSVVGDFLENLRDIKSHTQRILKSHGIRSLDISQRKISLTSVLPELDVLKAAQLFHKTYVEPICS